LVFSVVFVAAGFLILWLVRGRFRLFFARHPWAFTGVAVLCAFILVRAASINHVFEHAGFPDDEEHGVKSWSWVLEIGGSAALSFAAIKNRLEPDAGKPK
jgi:hypothetical protein